MKGFPIGKKFNTPHLLLQKGITLRSATMADISFLRLLYYQLRADELTTVPWPDSQKRAFSDSQFDLQHHHYLTYYSEAFFLLIENQSVPIGRLYLLQQADTFLIIDISLVSEWQNHGIGSILIQHIQKLAHTDQAILTLHVDQRNRAAYRLYTRLGFVYNGIQATHIKMSWSAKTNDQDLCTNHDVSQTSR